MLPYNYKLEVMSGITLLTLNGRKLGTVDEVELTDDYVTFKRKGVVVRQHNYKIRRVRNVPE